MTFEKWTEKAATITDGMLLNGCRAGNYSGGAVVFDRPGHQGYVMEDHQILAASPRELLPAGFVDGLMDKAARGSLAAVKRAGITDQGSKVYELTDGKGRAVCVQKKYLNRFPKNALYYIGAPWEPVAVGLMDRGTLHIIGLVCPVRYNTFKPEV